MLPRHLLASTLVAILSTAALGAGGAAAPRESTGSYLLAPAPAGNAMGLVAGSATSVSAAVDTGLSSSSAQTQVATEGSVQFDFAAAGLYGYSVRSIYTGSGAKVRLTPTWSWRGWGASAVQLQITVQRDTGAGWQNVAAGQYPVGEINITAPTFKTSAKRQKVRYRLHSAAYTSATATVRNDSYSLPVTVTYENQAKYTGFAKQMYGYMKPYCPQVAVHSVALISGRGDLAGQASGASQFVLVKRSGARLPAAYRRAIALHECGHIRQWLNYGASPTGDKLAAADEAKYFVNDNPPRGVGWPYSKALPKAYFAPVEHAADCGSIALNPKGYLGYGGYCNPSERSRAKALLLGKRYDRKPAVAS